MKPRISFITLGVDGLERAVELEFVWGSASRTIDSTAIIKSAPKQLPKQWRDTCSQPGSRMCLCRRLPMVTRTSGNTPAPSTETAKPVWIDELCTRVFCWNGTPSGVVITAPEAAKLTANFWERIHHKPSRRPCRWRRNRRGASRFRGPVAFACITTKKMRSRDARWPCKRALPWHWYVYDIMYQLLCV